ncbi:MAG TPA: DUF436 family protein [Rectinema sp.]|nr:DUF436 family protein [Rectinema sp.]
MQGKARFPAKNHQTTEMIDLLSWKSISAPAGMESVDMYIGMHLRLAAALVQFEIRVIDDANLTIARTRPKLMVGEAALYLKTYWAIQLPVAIGKVRMLRFFQ